MLEHPVCEVFKPLRLNFLCAEPRNSLILLPCASARSLNIHALTFLSLCLVTYSDTYQDVHVFRYIAETFSLQLSPGLMLTEFFFSPASARRFLSPFSFAQLLHACSFVGASFCFLSICLCFL